MVKLVIVEDSTVMREGLCQNIPWEEHNIQIIGAFENGQDALAGIHVLKPDLIITDIVMPFMDGIALAFQVKKSFPEIKLIVISAHDEFDYAQAALKNGVYDYLIKPIDHAQLLETIQRAIKDMRQEDAFREQVRKSIPVLQERFLVRLIEGVAQSYESADAEYLGLKFEAQAYVCILSEIDNLEQIKKTKNMETFTVQMLKMEAFMRESLTGMDAWMFQMRQGGMVVICAIQSGKASANESLHERLDQFRKNVEQKCEMTVTIGIGKTVSSIWAVSESYKKALDVLEYKFLLGNSRILDIADMEYVRPEELLNFPLAIEEKLLKKVYIGDKERAIDCAKELDDYFSLHKANKQYIKMVIMCILCKLYQILLESGIKSEVSRTKVLEEIHAFDTREEVFPWFELIIRQVCLEITKCMKKHHHDIILEAKDYIMRSYMKEDLSLNDVAREISISASYLSTIFKRETQLNLSEFIISVRMEKAQELLRNSDMKIAGIAELVGYANPHYFSNSFKKCIGLTPNDFRNGNR